MTDSTLAPPVAGEDDKASRCGDAVPAIGVRNSDEAADPVAPVTNGVPPALGAVTPAELLAAQELTTLDPAAMEPLRGDETHEAPRLEAFGGGGSTDLAPARVEVGVEEAIARPVEEPASGAPSLEEVRAEPGGDWPPPSAGAVPPARVEEAAPPSDTDTVAAAVEEAVVEVVETVPAEARPDAPLLPGDAAATSHVPPAVPDPPPAGMHSTPSLSSAPAETAGLAADGEAEPGIAAAPDRAEPSSHVPPANPAEPMPAQPSVPPPHVSATVRPLSSALDAAAKLAADANTAADALESLKRLLQRQQQGTAMGPAQSTERAAWRPTPPEGAKPPPLPSLTLPASGDRYRDTPPDDASPMPVPLPRKRAPERARFDLRGFLAGFALSWAVGVVLYLLMTAG
jgi:hypothetical protein